MATVAVLLVQLTGPDDQRIEVNPHEIVSVRAPRGPEHFAKGVRCVLHTTDGKFIAVVEDCDTVLQRLGEEAQE